MHTTSPGETAIDFQQFIRWQIITAFDIIIEILLFAISIYLVVGLKLRLARKNVVVTAFGFRLLWVHPRHPRWLQC